MFRSQFTYFRQSLVKSQIMKVYMYHWFHSPQPLGSSKIKTAIHSGTRLIQPCSHIRFKRPATASSETCNDFSPSLVTNWSPLIEFPHASKSYKPSFRSHYERLHSQGEAFLPDGDKLLKPRWKTLEAQFQREKDSCRQS